MSEYLEQAARVTDPVVHSNLDIPVALTVAGLLAGLVVVVAAAPISLGAGAALVITAGAEAQNLGEVLANRELRIDIASRNLPKTTGETIIDGAKTVFLDEPKLQAAKAHPVTKLTHAGHWVISGSSTVLIENTYASRIKDSAMCGGFVCNGSTTVFYGGAKQVFPGAPADPSEVLDMGLYGDASLALRVAEMILLTMEGVGAARALARSATRKPGLADQLPIGDDVGDAVRQSMADGVVPAHLDDALRAKYANAPDGTSFYGLYDTSTGRVVIEPGHVANQHRQFLTGGNSGHQATGYMNGLPTSGDHGVLGFTAVKRPEGPDLFFKSASYNEHPARTVFGHLNNHQPFMSTGPSALLEDAMLGLRPPGSTAPAGGPLSVFTHERDFKNWYGFLDEGSSIVAPYDDTPGMLDEILR